MFRAGADNMAIFPVEQLKSATCTADSTVVLCFGVGIKNSEVDKVTLTITADKEMEVLESILEFPSNNNISSVCVVADMLEGSYVSEYITGVAIALG